MTCECIRNKNVDITIISGRHGQDIIQLCCVRLRCFSRVTRHRWPEKFGPWNRQRVKEIGTKVIIISTILLKLRELQRLEQVTDRACYKSREGHHHAPADINGWSILWNDALGIYISFRLELGISTLERACYSILLTIHSAGISNPLPPRHCCRKLRKYG